mmetsp:Transcript_18918/g.57148  ORF Transcript_18918/g.57148 Transcript_18918/m.57148 type:complete len:116 (-) Transcript_18918:1170-1517(-)
MLRNFSQRTVARVQYQRCFAEKTVVEKVQEKAGQAMEKVGKMFESDGKVGEKFEKDGKVGGKIDKETSPNSKLDSEGSVGSKFKSDGEVGLTARPFHPPFQICLLCVGQIRELSC